MHLVSVCLHYATLKRNFTWDMKHVIHCNVTVWILYPRKIPKHCNTKGILWPRITVQCDNNIFLCFNIHMVHLYTLGNWKQHHSPSKDKPRPKLKAIPWTKQSRIFAITEHSVVIKHSDTLSVTRLRDNHTNPITLLMYTEPFPALLARNVLPSKIRLAFEPGETPQGEPQHQRKKPRDYRSAPPPPPTISPRTWKDISCQGD